MTSRESKPLSVSELSQILKACFENPAFSDLSVYGEVYSIRLGKFSYIDLGDQGKNETSSPLLRCAFSSFYGDDYGLSEIKVGDVITIRGSLSYYPHGSSVTLWGKSVEVLQNQAGKNLLAKKKTLEKLEKLGYLDEKRKRPIPGACQKVAILTAESGAAYQDILKTLHDRFPVSTVLYPVTVQGEGAAASIVKAMAKAQESKADVILLGRGGGSKSDLSCFDDEKVALAIAESRIPVITAIGHTIDTAIADRVSDVKAITPTEGASLINRPLSDVIEDREEFLTSLGDLFRAKIEEKALETESFRKRLEELSPLRILAEKRKKKDDYLNSLLTLFRSHLREGKTYLGTYRTALASRTENLLSLAIARKDRYVALLESLSPEQYAKRGFAEVREERREGHGMR
jgi:exodeoxyribonuclease VII large subunit